MNLALAIVAMFAATAAAVVMKPRQLMALSQKELYLEKALPVAFGQWRAAPGVRLVEPPGSDTLSHEIYNQEVARGYVDAEGHVVMLLVAYGESQSERLQLHRPEICYAAQGFSVSRPIDASLSYGGSDRPLVLRRVMTWREERIEPITYWMRIGYDVSEGLLERQRLKLEYGLRGLIPDGALFRVSTLGIAQMESYRIEDQFIRDLIAAVDPTMRAFMVGAPDRAFISRAPT
jgi:EpsI family protein